MAEKRGEHTIWNVMRSDIDDAVRRSMTEKQFIRNMKQCGYSFNLSLNRKYPTIRPEGYQKATRFNTLGENYSYENIIDRILANDKPYIPPPLKTYYRKYRHKGIYVPKHSVSGIYVIYLIFQMLQQKTINSNRIPDNPYKTRYTPQMRESIRRMRQYSNQTRLLCRYKVETLEQLQELIDSKNKERYGLEKERERVYNKMKYAKTPEKLVELKSERDILSTEIKDIRSDLFLLDDVKKRSSEVKRLLLAQREYETWFRETNKTKNIMKDRG